MALSSIESIFFHKRKANWVKDFPVTGQGTLIFSIHRNTKFFIVIRPKLDHGKPGANEWISLSVKENSASFSMHHDGEVKTLETVSEMVKNQPVGYEPGRKVSYWLSYNRDNLTIKYGKGYCMSETTLMTYDFLKGIPKEDHEKTREDLKYLFSPYIHRRIEQYDEMPPKMMLEKYKDAIKLTGSTISVKWPKLRIPDEVRLEEYAKSLIDIEQRVAFYKFPFVNNWSPIVLDSSKVNLYELDSSAHTFSASLPPACLELYSNVTAQDIELDWPYSVDKYKLSDAIRHSLEHGVLKKKLEEKEGEFGAKTKTYLRITLGEDRGSSPGIPYVLEIWPHGHGSPIHNHGNAYAVIKVLHGGLTIKIFNKQTDSDDAKHLQEFDVKKGDCTWISPNWFQTHQLWNSTTDYCATIQCYKYGENDFTHWPYFDYVADTDTIEEFLPDSDFTFHKMKHLVMEEYAEYIKEMKQR